MDTAYSLAGLLFCVSILAFMRGGIRFATVLMLIVIALILYRVGIVRVYEPPAPFWAS